ncbi:ParA family protein [Streptomyces sp. RLB1-9]|uniref:division plane positioning ATPase MipZ n=1 Tax=Streptomyces sp. RLB1-9 TaxID=2594454 RepID=UPI0013D92F9D|nr:ParA family protein [Streptomyces sp. RLB1-9]
MSNWRHEPKTEKELRRLMAPVQSIVKWVKTRRGFIIGVGILKGGTGKSTSVLYLALYFALVLNLKVVVVDTDDNSQSIARWVATHEALGDKIPFTLIVHPTKGADAIPLKKRLKPLKSEYDVIIVDLGGGDKETFIDLCAEGRLLFMPSAPSGWETDRIQATLQTASRAAILNTEGLDVYNFFVKCDFNSTLPEEEREAMAEDLSDIDEDFVPPPFLHPYFDISKAPHHVRSWNTVPKRADLEEWGLLVRHAMKGIIEEEDEAA